MPVLPLNISVDMDSYLYVIAVVGVVLLCLGAFGGDRDE